MPDSNEDKLKMHLSEELIQLNRRQKEILDKLNKPVDGLSDSSEDSLTNDEIMRYSRQLLLPEWSVRTQIKLSRQTKGVLVVGGGGLGCPAIQFMAAAGVTPIGVVDYDDVDLSNLHRQILHTEQRNGMSKVESICFAVQQLNRHVKMVPYHTSLDSTNALDIIKNYDVVLDASDNVATRYLLNDACVLAKKPLVSGSALRFEGQLSVYNYNDEGPTYRCLFPEPPPPETVGNCSDSGVVGVVPGIIGSLQAQEAMKIIGGFGDVLSGKMLLYDALSCRFTTVKLRPRSKHADDIKKLIDYEQFCGTKATDKDEELFLIKETDRMSVKTYHDQILPNENHILLDVRTEPEQEICKIKHSINVPLKDLDKPSSIEKINNLLKVKNTTKIITVCRRGNDSQKAVEILCDKLDTSVVIKDIKNGLYSWTDHIDPEFPKY